MKVCFKFDYLACLIPSIKKVRLKVNPGWRLETMANSSLNQTIIDRFRTWLFFKIASKNHLIPPMWRSDWKTIALAPPSGCCSMRIEWMRQVIWDDIRLLLGRFDGFPVKTNHKTQRGLLESPLWWCWELLWLKSGGWRATVCFTDGWQQANTFGSLLFFHQA